MSFSTKYFNKPSALARPNYWVRPQLVSWPELLESFGIAVVFPQFPDQVLVSTGHSTVHAVLHSSRTKVTYSSGDRVYMTIFYSKIYLMCEAQWNNVFPPNQLFHFVRSLYILSC